MEIITYSQLNNDILANLYKIPKDIDLIVGIPRSGLLVANMLALYLNKPLADIDEFLRGEIMMVGSSKNNKNIITEFSTIKKILVVDDSVFSGKSIKEARIKIQSSSLKVTTLYMAAYICTGKENYVDLYFRKIDEDRVFEWNYIHNKKLAQACFDIDGILCYDPTADENDDGANYLRFIENAESKLIPTRKIGYLVTSRLEKYREPTEKWLARNGIEYGQLFMMKGISAEERRKSGSHGKFKAEIYSRLKDATWFVESEPQQAQEIADLTRKCVFCPSAQSVYNENSIKRTVEYKRKEAMNSIKKYLKKVLPSGIITTYKKLKTK